MNKLSKKEYILKAAKLYGLTEFEIRDLEKDLNGKFENEFIERRTKSLFHMYDIYASKEYNAHMDTDENGIINLDDYSFVISNRRLLDSQIGKFWIISSNLDSYLVTDRHSEDVKSDYITFSEKNNFLFPQIAKQMKLPATVYYKGKCKDRDTSDYKIVFMTKDFLQDGETFIRGNSIYKRKRDNRKINFEALLEETDKYIKKYYKKNKLPADEATEARREIRQGLIKQTIFNKIAFNDNEDNSKWGIIIGEDKRLRLAPLYSFDYCAGVQSTSKSHHRVINGRKEDIESFIIKYGGEPWFRTWIKEEVIPLDIEKAVEDMKEETGVGLTDKEVEYYKFSIQKIHSRIAEIYEQNYGDGSSSSPKLKNEDEYVK